MEQKKQMGNYLGLSLGKQTSLGCCLELSLERQRCLGWHWVVHLAWHLWRERRLEHCLVMLNCWG